MRLCCSQAGRGGGGGGGGGGGRGGGKVCVAKGGYREGKCFLFVCVRVQCDIPPLIGAT